MTSVETIRQSVRTAMAELLDLAKVREGQLLWAAPLAKL